MVVFDGGVLVWKATGGAESTREDEISSGSRHGDVMQMQPPWMGDRGWWRAAAAAVASPPCLCLRQGGRGRGGEVESAASLHTCTCTQQLSSSNTHQVTESPASPRPAPLRVPPAHHEANSAAALLDRLHRILHLEQPPLRAPGGDVRVILRGRAAAAARDGDDDDKAGGGGQAAVSSKLFQHTLHVHAASARCGRDGDPTRCNHLVACAPNQTRTWLRNMVIPGDLHHHHHPQQAMLGERQVLCALYELMER